MINNFKGFLKESVTFNKKGLKEKLQKKIENIKYWINKVTDEKQKKHIEEKYLSKAEESLETGVLPGSYHEPWLIQYGEVYSGENSNYDIFKGTNSIDLVNKVASIITKYKKYEVDSTSISAMAGYGNTRATIGGFIDIFFNEKHQKGYFTENFIIGVKVGGGIKQQASIFTELYPIFFMLEQYNTKNGGVKLTYISGTNYSILGLTCSEYSYSKSTVEKLKNIYDLIIKK